MLHIIWHVTVICCKLVILITCLVRFHKQGYTIVIAGYIIYQGSMHKLFKGCCSENCNNRPFRKEKNFKIVKVWNFTTLRWTKHICIIFWGVSLLLGLSITKYYYQLPYMFFSIQTELCGWGVEAADTIDKGGFIIEYIGEGSSYYGL